MERPGNKDIQLDLFLDYASNLTLYPVFQKYFSAVKPPLLAIWGKHDPFFIPAGAEAYPRDNPNGVVEFLDTGHFALETHLEKIAGKSVDSWTGQIKRAQTMVQLEQNRQLDNPCREMDTITESSVQLLTEDRDHYIFGKSDSDLFWHMRCAASPAIIRKCHESARRSKR